MIARWPLLAVALAGCKVTYHHVNDIGGEMTVTIAPAEGETGLAADFTRDGMTEDELAEMLESRSYPRCASPRLGWSLDTDTNEPIDSTLAFCAPDVAIAQEGCDSVVDLTVEVQSWSGQLFVQLFPWNTEDGFASGLETLDLGQPLGPTGTISGTIPLDGDCVGEDVPHDITLTWDFPVHDERTTKVNNELCCGPLVGVR